MVPCHKQNQQLIYLNNRYFCSKFYAGLFLFIFTTALCEKNHYHHDSTEEKLKVCTFINQEAQNFMAQDKLGTVTRALINMQIEYCNALYKGLPFNPSQKLQLFWNMAACAPLTPDIGNILLCIHRLCP